MTIFKTNSLIFLKAYCVPVYVFTPTRKIEVEIHMCGMFLSMAVSFPFASVDSAANEYQPSGWGDALRHIDHLSREE